MDFEVNFEEITAERSADTVVFNPDGVPLTAAGINPFRVPYESVLCLDVAFRAVEQIIEDGEDAGAVVIAKALLDRVAKHPELRQPISDYGVLDKHEEILELLTYFVVPIAERNTAMYKFSVPFNFQPIYASPAMRRMMHLENVCYTLGVSPQEAHTSHVIAMGGKILRDLYGVEYDMKPTGMLNFPCPHSGLRRFFRPEMLDDNVEVIVKGEQPKLKEEDINRLLSNITDTELWTKLLPPDKFAFHGFHFSRMHEVTREEALSRIKHRLISRDAVLDVDRLQELADLARIYFQNKEFQLGIAAVDFPVERTIDHEYEIKYNLLADYVSNLASEECKDSIYHRAFTTRDVVVTEDLKKLRHKTVAERKLLTLGIRSIIVAPLLDHEKNVIGVLEMASPEPYGVNSFVRIAFEEIRTLFRTALVRSREYVDNRIEAILREQYTSLHQSVEWRFTKAAHNYLRQLDAGEQAVAEAIKFKEVYPLYGQADIVGSSKIRNSAIYQDLFDNIRAGRLVLIRALDFVSFPLINKVVMEIDELLTMDNDSFDNSEELRLGEFIHTQLTPLVEQLGRQHVDLNPLSRQYLEQLNPELGLFYRVRKDYEDSVTRLNRELSEFFTGRNVEQQKVTPHYFEKYKTDGVEYELYAGQSLLKTGHFNEIHLRNLRLSQLVDMCEATRLVDRLSEELPMPLRTAQLIFAYSSPLDISFRMDEKRFDVEGDYNVRYEILKKRIDKATIRRGAQRLTLADHISIVYLHDRDREEYEGYLNYLHQAGYVEGEVEQLVLDPLQSVNGLRALRFRVRVG